MRQLPIDWKEYLVSMKREGACSPQIMIVDPPWEYVDSIDRPGYVDKLQLDYEKWDTKSSLDYLFSSTSCDYIFMWVTNSKLREVLMADLHGYAYKTTLTWIKTTNTSNTVIHYGLGFYCRSSTEFMCIFRRERGTPPPALKFPIRNVFFGERGKRTSKPRELERQLIDLCIERGYKRFCYLFSGLSDRLLYDIDIDLIDIAIE